MNPQPGTGAVILGAGFSRRYGADKRLQPLGDSTVALTTCRTYCQVFPQVRVVLRDDDTALAEQLKPLGVETVIAELAHLGMGHSLAAGTRGLSWQWAFVGLMDMPFLQVPTLRELAAQTARADEQTILMPRLSAAAAARAPAAKRKQKAAHPIGWPRHYFAELQACSGDRGARRLLTKYRSRITYVEVDDPGVIYDIDTPADLAR